MLAEMRPFDGVRTCSRAAQNAAMKVVLASSRPSKWMPTLICSTAFTSRTHGRPARMSIGRNQNPTWSPSRWSGSAGTSRCRSVTRCGTSSRPRQGGPFGYAIRSGGFSDPSCGDAGARDVLDAVVDVREALDRILA